MATEIHYYGSVFQLTESTDDDLHRRLIGSYFESPEIQEGPIVVWFDLRGGGHVSLRLTVDTPLAIVTS
ncbi:hypothetical protein [Microbacterium sp. PAMC21962]|uniref:hypothetical protein n=1 Tax=Microbacterium sp. PAMC21962 TaxID=2861280 RepID=UPI001C6393CF|nr:hypothetical protein [Microbacterium sp. PAMC21962]QYF98940.1 hypothetical protein KY498_06920 [Microbacterium sp. PAMC21962]